MRKDRETALKLRLSGKSYSEIQAILGVPKSTLSSWLSQLVLPERLARRIKQRTQPLAIAALIRRNKRQTHNAKRRAEEIRRQAAKTIGSLTPKELQLIGAALYWAEGYKKPVIRNNRELTYHVVSLTNSDALLVRMFLKFLREWCHIPEEKISANLRVFPHQNPEKLRKFWQKQTGLPAKNFQKIVITISRASKGRRPYNQLPYGVIQIRVGDTRLFHQIMGYIEGLRRFV